MKLSVVAGMLVSLSTLCACGASNEKEGSGGSGGSGGDWGSGGSGGSGGGTPMPKPLECTQQTSIPGIDRGSENGLDRFLAITEDQGDLVGVITSKTFVDFVRWPAAGGDPIRTTIATGLDYPSAPSIAAFGGTIHVTWTEFATGFHHAVSSPGGFVSEVFAPDATTGGLVRGAAIPEILWIDTMGLIHTSKYSGGMWMDTATDGYGSQGGTLEAIKDAAGHFHVAQASSGSVGYMNNVNGTWSYDSVHTPPPNVYRSEASLALKSSGDAYVAWAEGPYVQWEQYKDGAYVAQASLTKVGLDDALGVGLTMRGDTPWFVTATWPASGPGVIYTPITVGSIGTDNAKIVDYNAYTSSPALLWIGATLHVVWARYGGFSGSSTIAHSTCQQQP